MNVASGGIHDNPWDGVVASSAHTTSAHPQRRTTSTAAAAPAAATCTDVTLHKLVQFFLVLDVLGCLSGILYGLVVFLLRHNNDKDDDDEKNDKLPLWPTLLILVTAAWLGIRTLCVTAALWYSHILELCGLYVASQLSIVVGLQTIFLSLLSAIYRKSMHHADWWTQHFALAHDLVLDGDSSWILTHVQPWLWLILLLLALSEVPVRWYLYHAYRYRLLQQEEQDLQQTALISHASTRRRPWWWSHNSHHNSSNSGRRNSNLDLPTTTSHVEVTNDNSGENGNPDLRRALLEGEHSSENEHENHRNHGLPQWARERHSPYGLRSNPAPSSSIFSWLFGRKGNDDDHNPRDDGSVDFASVQEEWASRSEEDPLWWSRDHPPPVGSGGVAAQRMAVGSPSKTLMTPSSRVVVPTGTATNDNRDRSTQATNPQEARIPDFVDATTSPNSSGHPAVPGGASVVSEL